VADERWIRQRWLFWTIGLGFAKDGLQEGKSEWRKEEEGGGLYTFTMAKNVSHMTQWTWQPTQRFDFCTNTVTD
jgi:hypothetical protein